MPSNWITALREWNSGKDTWCIPRRNTTEYDEVKAIMEKNKAPVKKIITKTPIKRNRDDVRAIMKKNKAPVKKVVKITTKSDEKVPEPKPEPERVIKKEVDKNLKFEECKKIINDTMKFIYSNRKSSRDWETLQKQAKEKRKYFDIITGSDFYPTPPEYSKLIYDDFEPGENTSVYDIATGLGALSIEFINNHDKIKSLTMIDIQEPFIDMLKCFEKHSKNIYVVNADALKYNLNIDKNDRVLIMSNPPFRASINGKMETNAWLFFMVYLYHNYFTSIYKSSFYFIVPKSPLFKSRVNSTTKIKIGDEIYLDIPEATKKRMMKVFDIDEEYIDIDYMTYFDDVKGFKGITKNGSARKAPDAIMVKIGG